MLEGRYHLEYVPAVSAPCAALSASPPLAAAPNEQSAPPSPLPDIDSGSESQANTGSARPSARAVRVRLRPLAPPTAPSSPSSPAVSSVAADFCARSRYSIMRSRCGGASQFSPSSRRRRHFLCAGVVVAVGTLAWCFEFSSGRRGGQPNAHCGGRAYALSNSRFTCANSIDYRSIRLFFLFARKSYLFIPPANGGRAPQYRRARAKHSREAAAQVRAAIGSGHRSCTHPTANSLTHRRTTRRDGTGNHAIHSLVALVLARSTSKGEPAPPHHPVQAPPRAQPLRPGVEGSP